MSGATKDPDHIARMARELIEQDTERRVAAVRAIIHAARTVEDAERALNDARTAHTQAWNNAITAGWTNKDLRATGAPTPHPRRRTVPKTRPTGAPPAATP